MPNKIKKITLYYIFLLFIISSFFLLKKTKAENEIFGFAWNEVFGWLDFNNNQSQLTALKLSGYASSNIGEVSFDCETSPIGNICSNSNYQVKNMISTINCEGYNQSTTALAGYAWNDQIGWISFCGGQNNSDCPGNINYGVYINISDGKFYGYAWNDLVGWISFNSQDYGGNINYNTQTMWRLSKKIGTLESNIFDTQTYGTLNSIIWQGTKPSINTDVKFQIAVSNNPNGPWNYYGPNQDPNSYFGVNSSPDQPIVIKAADRQWVKNQRYLRYKVYLESDLCQTQTPIVNKIILNWSK